MRLSSRPGIYASEIPGQMIKGGEWKGDEEEAD